MRLFYIFVTMICLLGAVGGCINIDANTKVDGADKYSAIGEKYADKYAGTENNTDDEKDD